MYDITELNQFQELTKRTHPKNVSDLDRLVNASMGIAGEAGEVVDHVKKALFQGHALDRDKLKNELGDVLHYIAVAGWALDIDLQEIAQANIEKLQMRYPNGFSKEASIARVDIG